MNYKIDKETAELEFKRFVDKMRIDVELDGDTEEDVRDFSLQKGRMLKAIMQGTLTVDEEGKPAYTPQYGEDKTPVVFNRPTGVTIKSFNKSGQDINTAMADMTRRPNSFFSKMDYYDLKTCISVVNLFLA